MIYSKILKKGLGIVFNMTLLFLLSTVSCFSATAVRQVTPDPAAQANQLPYAKDRIIIQFKDTVSFYPPSLIARQVSLQNVLSPQELAFSQILNRYKATKIDPLFPISGQQSITSPQDLKTQYLQSVQQIKDKYPLRSLRAPKGAVLPDLYNYYIIYLQTGVDPQEAVNAFKRDTNVADAGLDYFVSLNMTPNDFYYSSTTVGKDLWGIKKIGMASAWDKAQGNGIVVAVNDSGVDYNHKDIADNMWSNAQGEHGWNYQENNALPMDPFGHGTHVAGIIGAVGNNQEGIIGVAFKSKIMALRSIPDEESRYPVDASLRAIRYAVDNGADIINNSFGPLTRIPLNQAARVAVQYAYYLGVINVFSAGNDFDDVQFKIFGNIKEAFDVSATDRNDLPMTYSNFGQFVDVSAPGVGILSLNAQGGNNTMVRYGAISVDTYYMLETGTSMAAPFVSGAAALILQKHPEFTIEEVRQALRISSLDLGAKGFDEKFGYGRLNVAEALKVDSVLTATIDSPSRRELTRLNSNISIIGTASGNGFKNYQLFYSVGSVAGNWIPLADPVYQPVLASALGSLDARAFAKGKVWIKLVVTRNDGKTFEAKTNFYLQDPVEFRQVTSSNLDHKSFAVSANRFAFIGDNGLTREIYLYDQKTGLEKQISSDGLYKESVDMDADYVVWDGRDNDYNYSIYLYKISTGELRLLAPAGKHKQPQVSGQKVVWVEIVEDNKIYDVYSYDATTQKGSFLTSGANVGAVTVLGDFVVWQDNYKIVIYNDKTKERRTVPTGPRLQYLSSMDNDNVVFMDGNFSCKKNQTPDTNSCTIYVQDLRSDRLTKIYLPDAYVIEYPVISKDKIAYIDNRDGKDVYLYDMKNSKEQRITYNSSYAPVIAEGKLYFYNYNKDYSQIFQYDLPPDPVADVASRDLLITDLTGVSGGLVFSGVIDNKGTIPASASALFLELEMVLANGSKEKVASWIIPEPAIDPGKSFAWSKKVFGYGEQSGKWLLTVTADINQTVNESNKSNNSISKLFETTGIITPTTNN